MKATRLTIHCSATKNGQDVSIQTIRAWHLARGWKDIGYHYVIYPDGTVVAGRPESEEGAHVEGENKDNLGVCLIGTDRFTWAQIGSLCNFIAVKKLPVCFHSQFASAKKQKKTCPNLNQELFTRFFGLYGEIRGHLI